MDQELFNKVKECGVIPVIAIESPDDALNLADALIEGGLPCAEITFRTVAAGKVIETLGRERPELILGAGTVLTVDNLKRAADSGAKFGVAPGLNPAILEAADKMGFPFVPGVVTPSEVEEALSYGLSLLKFFPAAASGGIKMIEALYAPYGHRGVQFMPTGGVKTGNLGDYLSSPAVPFVGGTWVAKKDMIAEKQWEAIKKNCVEAVELVRSIRAVQ
jgi:2-dehydro-3-deoxyphosphogluconate aldolase/(4S)-4-hydroxy-2-oxoglutarate aldolase